MMAGLVPFGLDGRLALGGWPHWPARLRRDPTTREGTDQRAALGTVVGAALGPAGLDRTVAAEMGTPCTTNS